MNKKDKHKEMHECCCGKNSDDTKNELAEKHNNQNQCDCKEKEEKRKELKEKLQQKEKEVEDYIDRLQRIRAEFENYKKRTTKEKELIYKDAVCDIISALLPVVDNFERAIDASTKEGEFSSLKEGIDLVFRQLKNAMEGLGVKQIDCLNKEFNPDMHNAVMHIEDENHNTNTVVEEFQKGYIYDDKVIRHSMVKVAN